MLLIYFIIYFTSIIFYYLNLNYIASVIMIALAIILYYYDYKKYKRIVNIRSFFALGFIGGFGISLLKLSNLSQKYSLLTIITVFVAFFSFYVGSFLEIKSYKKYIKKIMSFKNFMANNKIYLFLHKNFTNRVILYIVIFISFFAFLFEWYKLKFLPILCLDVPHAYSTFHIFMVHYITTLFIFSPSISLINLYDIQNKTNKNKIILKYKFDIIISIIYSVIMSIILVSRAQLTMSILIFIYTYLTLYNFKIKNLKRILLKLKIRILKIFFVCIIIICFLFIYKYITFHRAHSLSYLSNIYDMKNNDIPYFIAQPYTYIANNYENLNNMIIKHNRFTFGRKILFPLWTFTFVKKFFPLILTSTDYFIKYELTTTTFIYDFYYDFGIVGVIIFCFLIGFSFRFIEDIVYFILEKQNIVSKTNKNVILIYKNNTYITILFSLLSYYMLFSFFQPYMSLTDTWVYIIFLLFIYVFSLIIF